MTKAHETTLTLPWPPTLNTYWRHVGSRTLISREGRAYRDRVMLEVLRNRTPRIDGRLAVDILAYPPDRRVRDLDNLPKAILDALRHARVYDDDGQIDDLLIRRGNVEKGGMVRVWIRTIGLETEPYSTYSPTYSLARPSAARSGS
jgi:crossover junction endodeoxyribonuclease RusA